MAAAGDDALLDVDVVGRPESSGEPMRTTINLDDDLIEQARRLTGMSEKTALVREAYAP